MLRPKRIMAEKKWALELNILSRQAQWNFIPRWRNIYAPEKVEYEQGPKDL